VSDLAISGDVALSVSAMFRAPVQVLKAGFHGHDGPAIAFVPAAFRAADLFVADAFAFLVKHYDSDTEL
jgi:hypothetical protein